MTKRKLESLNLEEEGCKTKKLVSILSDVQTFTRIKYNHQGMEQSEAKNELTTIGYFSCLPNEIILKILKLLEIKDLTNLTIVNSVFRDFVILNFIDNSYGFRLLLRARKFEDIDLSEDNTKVLHKTFDDIGKFHSKF